MHLRFALILGLVVLSSSAAPSDLIPSLDELKKDRPRLLLRATGTPLAVSLSDLKALPRDVEYQQMLHQLETLTPPRAAALAMVYQLTGRKEAAGKALQIMAAWQTPTDAKAMSDPFNVYFTCLDLALAYDWLHDYPGFSEQAKFTVRSKVRPLVERAFFLGNDHVFHNYIWMFNSGAMLWALATAGEDPGSDRLLAGLTDRFNHQLFRAMEYLDGGNGDSAGYWWLYCESAAVYVLLAAQTAFETDIIAAIRREHHNWLDRQLDFLVHGVLPDMRFAPWGDIVAGPNGGVMREMASKIDRQVWALHSPHGAFLSQWLASKRGLKRYEGDTAIFYFLYGRKLGVAPAPPPLAYLAGNKQGGCALMRSSWEDDATVVGFRCTDFFGQHLHLDQGSFFIYRNGMLALDAGLYQRVGGSQMNTDAHNTLLFGGEGQRPQKFQSAATLDAFTQRLGKGLETGDILFFLDAGPWTAVAGQFAQAYRPEVVQSCVRQLLFLRPDHIVVLDQLAAPEGKTLPEVRWLLQVPTRPEFNDQVLTAANSRSYLRCRAFLADGRVQLEDSYRTAAGPSSASGNPGIVEASRAAYVYAGNPRLTLLHVLEIGDGKPPATPVEVKFSKDRNTGNLNLNLEGKNFEFLATAPYEIREIK